MQKTEKQDYSLHRSLSYVSLPGQFYICFMEKFSRTSKASRLHARSPLRRWLLDWTPPRACCCRYWAPPLLLLLLPWPTDKSTGLCDDEIFVGID